MHKVHEWKNCARDVKIRQTIARFMSLTNAACLILIQNQEKITFVKKKKTHFFLN